MTIRLPRTISVLVTAAAVLGAALATPRPAQAGDLETVRARAQAVANQVTDLEQSLSSLRQRQSDLAHKIEDASALIGSYELRRHQAEAVLSRAERAYQSAAVAQYESPDSTTMVALMLSSKSLSQFYALHEAAAAASDRTKNRLEHLLAARASLDRSESRIDERKQFLLDAKAEADALARKETVTLAQRKQDLDRLMIQVHDLERKARQEARQRVRAARAAAQASSVTPSSALQDVLGSTRGSGVTASHDIPKGYVSTGVSFQGEASWYGPGFEGQSTASGQIFHSNLMTAASKELPIGTHLFVSYNGRGVVVLINDRGPYVSGRVLDLSAGAARAIGLSGVGWVTAEIVVKS